MDNRVQVLLDFSQRAITKLDDLVIKSGAKSRVGAIRNAIRLYDWWLDELQKGSKFVVKRGDTYSEIEVIF